MINLRDEREIRRQIRDVLDGLEVEVEGGCSCVEAYVGEHEIDTAEEAIFLIIRELDDKKCQLESAK